MPIKTGDNARSSIGRPALRIFRWIRSGAGRVERRRRVRHGPENAGKSATLQQLAAFAASPRHAVLRRADRLLGSARRLDGQQVAIAGRRDEAEDAIVLADL